MAEDAAGQDLAQLVSRRHVIELLDILAERPSTNAELRSRLRGRRRDVDATLRVLAAAGAIHRPDQPGSWDDRATASVEYALTRRGQDLVETLSRLEVWTALYDHHLYESPQSTTDHSERNDL